MKKRVAVSIESIPMQEIDPQIRRIMLFEAADEVITAVDEAVLSLADIDYLCLWLLGKRVEKIYCDGIDRSGTALLERAGIRVFPLDAIRDHPVLQALLLKRENGT